MAALQLPGTVTLDQVTALLLQAEAAATESPGTAALQVDAGALKVFDTSAVALLLATRRLAQSRGLAFEIVAAPPKLALLADLYGVAGLLSLSPPSPPSPPGRSLTT